MSKLKLDFITFHNAYNYGASLQTYATKVFFENHSFDVSIIDYVPNYLKDFGKIKNTFNQVDNKKKNLIIRIIYTIIKNPSYKKLRKNFEYFNSKYLKFTKKYNSYLELKNDIPKADLYCCGSDQIWNNYYTQAFEDAFYLNFLNEDAFCFSFSSSFGKSDFNDIEKSYIKKSLSKFNFITVREKNGLELLTDLGFHNASILLDPTLMIDYTIWDKFASASKIKGKYILLYQLHGDSDALNYALEFSKKNNLKVIRIITMYHQIRFGCTNIVVPTVEEFVSLFKNAEYVFTDSFHGTAFSLIFKKKLGVRLPVRFSNRIVSLLSLINAKNFIIDDFNKWEDNITEEYVLGAHKRLIDYRNKVELEFTNKLNKEYRGK